jgi:carbonic anhydrase
MIEKIYDLGIKKPTDGKWFYYVKSEPNGKLSVYKFRHNQKSVKFMETTLDRNLNKLSWHFVKADENGNLCVYRTLRTVKPKKEVLNI